MVAHFNDYDPFKEESYLKAMAENLPSKEIEDYFLEEEADSYLSSLEAHESIFWQQYTWNIVFLNFKLKWQEKKLIHNALLH